MKQTRFFLTTSGMILVVPNDGTPDFFMTAGFVFDRAVTPAERDHLVPLLKKVFFTQRDQLLVPAFLPWSYIGSFTETREGDSCMGHIFGRVLKDENQVAVVLPTWGSSKLTLFGVIDVPADVSVKVNVLYDYKYHTGNQIVLEHISNKGQGISCGREAVKFALLHPSDTTYQAGLSNMFSPPNGIELAERKARCVALFGEEAVINALDTRFDKRNRIDGL